MVATSLSILASPVPGAIFLLACLALALTMALFLRFRLVRAKTLLGQAEALALTKAAEAIAASRATEHARESFEHLFDNVAAGIAIIQHGKYRQVNKALSDLTGFSPDEVEGQQAGFLVVAEAVDELESRMMARLAGKFLPDRYETTARHKDGSTFPIEVAARRIAYEGEPAILVVAHDLSERRETEEALSSTQAKVRSLFETMSEGFLLAKLVEDEKGVPRDYTILEVNRAFTRHTGLATEEAVGGLGSAVLGRGAPPFLDVFSRIVATGQPAFFESRFEALDRLLAVSAFSPLPGRFAAVFSDVTDRRRMEDEKKTLEEMLHHSQKMEAIGTLASGVAHDFNNLLGGILGYAELLRDGLAPEEPEWEFADIIHQTTKRAAALTSQLLAFARKGKLKTQGVDVHEIVRDVSSLLSRTIDRRIRLETDLSAAPSRTLADPAQLQNAILNLALNGRDAMTEGGTLTLATASVTLDEEQCEQRGLTLVPGPYLEISVQDTGAGMDGETLRHVFDPFFTTKGFGEASGLGLAAVYGIARSHHGAVTAESNVDAGSTFRLLLPLLAEDTGTAPVEAPEEASPTTGHVLVVDDEEVIRRSVRTMLEKAGYTVALCADGAEAVDLFQRDYESIDLVILDLIMPVMYGTEAFHAMQAVDPEARVMLMTGFALERDLEELCSLGALRVLEKPFTKRELLYNVARALEEPKSPTGPSSQ